MRWPIYTIDSIKSKQRYSLIGGPFGSNLTTRDYVDDGVPVIRGANLPDDRTFHDDDFVYVSDDKADQLSSNLAFSGDLIITQRGTLGQVGLIPEGCRFKRYVLSQSQMKLTVDRAIVDPLYAYYFFRQPSTVQFIRNHDASSGVPHINLGVLKSMRIPMPPLVSQQRIADTVGGYDNLIDNNRRRIQLLEDSVRLLFDEWFVQLRFPGHGQAAMTAGWPDDWPRATLQQVCVPGSGIQTGPFGSQLHQADYADEGVPVVMPKDLATMRVSLDTIARIPESLADELGRHRMQRGDIVYGRRGDIGRRAYIGGRQQGYFCGTGCLRLRADPAQIHPRFLFEILGSPEVAGEIANRAKGSTMANLSAGALRTVTVPIPPRALQNRFAPLAEDVGEMIDTLTAMNTKLRTARDLLLPRLMSGELTV